VTGRRHDCTPAVDVPAVREDTSTGQGLSSLPGDDVEGIMVYLASDDSAYATGGILTVYGGLTARYPTS
jgi:hypothetical protein